MNDTRKSSTALLDRPTAPLKTRGLQRAESEFVKAECAFVHQWVKEKRTCDEGSTRSLQIGLLASVLGVLVVVTTFSIKSVCNKVRVQAPISISAPVNAVHAQARARAAAGDASGAQSLYLKAIELAKTDTAKMSAATRQAHAEMLNELGVSLTASGLTEQSVHVLREAVALDPQLVAAHHNLALSLMANGDRQGALQSLNDSVQVAPQHKLAASKIRRMLAPI